MDMKITHEWERGLTRRLTHEAEAAPSCILPSVMTMVIKAIIEREQ